jgi:hypothetical protein
MGIDSWRGQSEETALFASAHLGSETQDPRYRSAVERPASACEAATRAS